MDITCDTCGIRISWQPTLIGKGVYCCTGCAEGGPCSCDYGSLPERNEPAAIVIAERRQFLPAQRNDASQKL